MKRKNDGTAEDVPQKYRNTIIPDDLDKLIELLPELRMRCKTNRNKTEILKIFFDLYLGESYRTTHEKSTILVDYIQTMQEGILTNRFKQNFVTAIQSAFLNQIPKFHILTLFMYKESHIKNLVECILWKNHVAREIGDCYKDEMVDLVVSHLASIKTWISEPNLSILEKNITRHHAEREERQNFDINRYPCLISTQYPRYYQQSVYPLHHFIKGMNDMETWDSINDLIYNYPSYDGGTFCTASGFMLPAYSAHNPTQEESNTERVTDSCLMKQSMFKRKNTDIQSLDQQYEEQKVFRG